MKPVLALDIGGTKLVAAVISGDGTVRGRRTTATQSGDGAGLVLERAIDLAEKVAAEHAAGEPLTSLGVSTKGLTRGDGVSIQVCPAGRGCVSRLVCGSVSPTWRSRL